MVLSDSGTGNLVICEHQHILSDKDDFGKTKFVVTVKPKILCMPKIFPSADELN